MNKLIIPTIILIILTPLFILKVKTVTCSIANTPCSNDELKVVNDTLQNKSLFFLDISKELESNQEFNKQFILDTYTKELSGKINLIVIKKEPLYKVNLDNKNFLVTKQGHLLESTTELKLPLVTWHPAPNSLVTTQKINPKFHKGLLTLLTQLKTFEISTKEINWLSDEKIKVTLENNLHFILDIKGLSTKAQAIKLINDSKEIQALEQGNKEVDLRFKLPVLHITQ